MAFAELSIDSSLTHPLDVLEELAEEREWKSDRQQFDEMSVEVPGRWCGFNLYFSWDDENCAVHTSCTMLLNQPCEENSSLRELLAAVNSRLWLGHFDIMNDPPFPLFRHTLPLRGTIGVSTEQLEDLVHEAVDACERYFPAFQMVVERGRTAREALFSALVDTKGSA